MTAEDRADRGAGQVLRDARGRSTLEQGPEPGLVGRRHEVEELWVVAVQLLAQPIGEAAEFLLQVVFEARELPQLQEEGMLGFKPPEGREVGGKGGRQDLSVAPIVFGAGDREAIAEAVELLGIEGKDVEAPGEEDIDNRPARHLQRDSHGLDGAGGQLRQPVGKALKRRSLMAHLALPHDPALGIQHHNAMLLSRPVDPDVEAVDGSAHRSPFLRAAEPQRRIAPCTGAHSAIPHRMGTVAGLPRRSSVPGAS